jgi:hypothetical protein
VTLGRPLLRGPRPGHFGKEFVARPTLLGKDLVECSAQCDMAQALSNRNGEPRRDVRVVGLSRSTQGLPKLGVQRNTELFDAHDLILPTASYLGITRVESKARDSSPPLACWRR